MIGQAATRVTQRICNLRSALPKGMKLDSQTFDLCLNNIYIHPSGIKSKNNHVTEPRYNYSNSSQLSK